MEIRQIDGLPPEPQAEPTTAPAGTIPVTKDVTLADGRTVTLAKPRGAKTLLVYELLGPGNSDNRVLESCYRTLLHVTHINGKGIHAPQTKLDLMALAEQLGDDALDELVPAYVETFLSKPMQETLPPLSETPSDDKSSPS